MIAADTVVLALGFRPRKDTVAALQALAQVFMLLGTAPERVTL